MIEREEMTLAKAFFLLSCRHLSSFVFHLSQVWPGEAIGLLSPEPLKTIAHNTLRTTAPWTQTNSFCNVYSQAARSGMPLSEWLPQLRNTTVMANLVVHWTPVGGSVEVAGVVQVFADLMLQSITPIDAGAGVDVDSSGSDAHYLALFPLQFPTDVQFSKLRGKGGFLVSASWDAASSVAAGSACFSKDSPHERCRRASTTAGAAGT